MSISSVLTIYNKRTMLTSLATVALLTTAGMANAALFNNLPREKDAELSAGVTVLYANTAYDTDENEIRVLPGLFYDNNKVYARGAQAGAYLINDGTNQLAATLQLSGNSFDPDDANGALQGLDERKLSADAGLSYQRRTAIGGLRAQYTTDVLDRSGGNSGRLSYIGRVSKNKLTVYPSIGFEYHDTDYNNYYYGVSSEESARTGIVAYESNSSLNPYVNVSANYDFSNKWAGFFNQSLSYLPNEQYDSPMVDSRTESTTTLGLLYKF